MSDHLLSVGTTVNLEDGVRGVIVGHVTVDEGELPEHFYVLRLAEPATAAWTDGKPSVTFGLVLLHVDWDRPFTTDESKWS